LFPVWTQGKWGFIDRQGKLVIGAQFDGVQDSTGTSFFEGLAAVCVGKCAFVQTDASGEKSGGRYIMHERFEGKWGYIDGSGRMVINPRFTAAGRFESGRAPVSTKERWLDPPSYGNVLEGYIDRAGNLVISEQFDYAGNFDRESGLAVVCVGRGDDSRCGFIDVTGRFVINPQFYSAYPFEGGLAGVQLKKNGPRSYVDRAGRLVWKSKETEPQEWQDVSADQK
jgi:hypothetical protein